MNPLVTLVMITSWNAVNWFCLQTVPPVVPQDLGQSAAGCRVSLSGCLGASERSEGALNGLCRSQVSFDKFHT